MKTLLLAITSGVWTFSVSNGLAIAPYRSPVAATSRRLANLHRNRDSLPLSFGPHHTSIGGSPFETAPSLASISGGSSQGGATETKRRRGLDIVALAKYGVGLGVQLLLIYGIFTAIDKLVAKFALKIPPFANFVFFYIFNILTAALNPLKRQTETKEEKKFVQPSWTPPGYVFAIMWPLFVFGIRAATASMVVSASGGDFATPTLMFLMLHLGFGNLWNTV
jgi:hypothetical protein